MAGVDLPNDFQKRLKLYKDQGLESKYGSFEGSDAQNEALRRSVGGASYESSKELNKYLKNYQDVIKEQRKKLEQPTKSTGDMFNEVQNFVVPDKQRPEIPNLVNLFNNLRSESNIGDLEGRLAELDNVQQDIESRVRERTGIEEGKPVPINVISGRVGEVERQELFRLDFIGRQKDRLSSQLNSQYKLIDTIINLTGKDYDNAVTDYQAEFNQNMSIYKIVNADQQAQRNEQIRSLERAQDKVFDLNKTLATWEREDIKIAEDSAKSNLQIYSNLIASGNLDMKNLPSKTKAEITKLEVKSGLGVGFLNMVKPKLEYNSTGGYKIISTTTRKNSSGTKYADIVYKSGDGSIGVINQPLGDESLTKDQQLVKIKSEMFNTLVNNSGKDKYVSPFTYKTLKDAWMSKGYSSESYDKEYSDRFANPSHIEDYQITQY